jgi:hypothetical protein
MCTQYKSINKFHVDYSTIDMQLRRHRLIYEETNTIISAISHRKKERGEKFSLMLNCSLTRDDTKCALDTQHRAAIHVRAKKSTSVVILF